MSDLEMTLDQAVDHLTKGARAFDAAERFESRVHAFREAVLEGEADEVHSAAAILVEDIWRPQSVGFVRRAVFEFSRAMNEGVSPAIRMVLQHQQAYALEALAEGVMELIEPHEDSGDAAGPDGGSGGDDGGSMVDPAAEALQQAA